MKDKEIDTLIKYIKLAIDNGIARHEDIYHYNYQYPWRTLSKDFDNIAKKLKELK